MKLKQITIIAILLIVITQSQAQSDEFYGKVINTPPPSEETWDEIQNPKRRPELRQAPDEDGSAQKEVPVPLSENLILNTIILTGSLGFYAIRKNKLTKTKL